MSGLIFTGLSRQVDLTETLYSMRGKKELN